MYERASKPERAYANSSPSNLQELSLFSGLFQSEMDHLSQISEVRQANKHSYIYSAGQHSTELYFLHSGCIKIGSYHEDGREVIKRVVHPGEMFGELGLVGERYRKDFAKSFNKPVKYYAIKIEDFKGLMYKNSDLSLSVLQQIGLRLRQIENKLEAMVFQSSRDRIVAFLKETANKRGRQIGYETLIRHSFTHQDIANITGTSRQTVTCVLNNLKKANMIHIDRKNILIRDMESLH